MGYELKDALAASLRSTGRKRSQGRSRSFEELLRELVEDADLVVQFEIEPRNSRWAEGKFVCTLTADTINTVEGRGKDLAAALGAAAGRDRHSLR